MRHRAHRALTRGILRGVATAFVLAAASLQVFAAASVRLPDGTLLAVWEVRARVRPHDPDGGGSYLAYSVTGPDAVIQGTVTGTDDPAADAAPRLAIDPTSGQAVALWSRFDGVYSKIAYAKFSGASWSSPHFLTFGSGDDTEPRVAVARDGAFLFYISGGNRYLYAPVELTNGHLSGSPRDLLQGPSAAPRAVADIPVNLKCRHCSGTSLVGWSSGGVSVNAATDIPVVIGTDGGGGNQKRASLWGTGSRTDCRNAVVVLPNPTATLLRVLSFTDGSTREIDRVHLPASIPDGLADQTAADFLNTYCN